MQPTAQATNSMYVPNWLIALELSAGAALLYISSSALMNTDMHISRSVETPATIEKVTANVVAGDETIILSARADSSEIFTK